MAEPNKIEQSVSGELLQFPIKEEEKVVVKLPKLKKGTDTPKKTPNNSKENRDTTCPIKEEDIPKMIKYFRNRIDSVPTINRENIARRDMALFVCGINIGLRAGDLVSLKWNDVYNDDWTFKDGKKIKPEKTKKKNKHITLKYNDAFRQAIDYFREYRDIKDMNDYIFFSGKSSHIGVDPFGVIIKDVAEAVGIKYNVCTHSMRKTFARVRYDHSEDKGKTLVELMKIYKHSSPAVTLDYIGITDGELEDLYNDVNLGLDEMY